MVEIICFALLFFNGVLFVENLPQQDKDAIAFDYKKEEFDLNTGRYSYSFQTSNGISREESGAVSGEDENAELEVRGSYSFTSPEGTTYTVVYTAGKNGYQATVYDNTIPTIPKLPSRISGKLLESLSGG